jgi:farnesyl-diphosphate farnesyltransferase
MAHAPLTLPDPMALLQGVSRSFYLSIRLLPAPLREPVGLGYLLARATDTIADTAQLAPALRCQHLAALAHAIEHGNPAPEAIALLAESFAALQQDPHERRLITLLPQCLAWLARIDAADRDDIRTVLRHITRGQALDVERFGQASGVRALANADELNDYTWLVAGCVGEFWTALCARHLPGFARLDTARMNALGRRYGQGLQLINILRDLGADLTAGRCYLPADALADAGLAPADLLARPEAAQAIYRHWLDEADRHLADGMAYVDALQSRRLRAASALPALLGARTLALLRAAGPGALRQRVKVPRHEVRTVLLRLAITLAGRGALAAQFERLRR